MSYTTNEKNTSKKNFVDSKTTVFFQTIKNNVWPVLWYYTLERKILMSLFNVLLAKNLVNMYKEKVSSTNGSSEALPVESHRRFVRVSFDIFSDSRLL